MQLFISNGEKRNDVKSKNTLIGLEAFNLQNDSFLMQFGCCVLQGRGLGLLSALLFFLSVQFNGPS